MSHVITPRFATLHLVTLGALLSACAETSGGNSDWGDTGDSGWPEWTEAYSSCAPQMVHFPVGDAHNIGYDHASCGSGTCDISCPDDNANSDWGGRHHGIDIFAYQGAPLTAVATGEIVAVGTIPRAIHAKAISMPPPHRSTSRSTARSSPRAALSSRTASSSM